MGRTTGEKISLRVALEQWREDGVHVETWSAERLQSAEPNLVPLPSSTAAYFLPDEVLRPSPPRILKALRETLEPRPSADPRTGRFARLGRVAGRYECTCKRHLVRWRPARSASRRGVDPRTAGGAGVELCRSSHDADKSSVGSCPSPYFDA